MGNFAENLNLGNRFRPPLLMNIRKKLKKLKKVKEILLAKPENNLKASSLNLLSQTSRPSITTLLIGKMPKFLQGSVSRMCVILNKPSGSDVVHPTR